MLQTKNAAPKSHNLALASLLITSLLITGLLIVGSTLSFSANKPETIEPLRWVQAPRWDLNSASR